MQSSDRELTCTSCSRPFMFTAAEQAFFAERGFQEPRRCKPCRNARKAEGGAPGGGGRDRQNGPMQNARGGGSNGQQRGGRGGQPGNGRNAPRDPNVGQGARYGEELPPPSDPNGYRAPGFATASTDPHAIDYAGLPRDEEDDAANNGNVPSNPFSRDQNADRFGLRSSAPSSFGGNTRFGGGGRRGQAQGGAPRASSRDGYRSPAFANSAPADSRGQAPRNGGGHGAGGGGAKQARQRRPLIETTCATCGAAARVPFEPSAERPAFCKPCFDAKRPARTETPAT